MLRVLRAGLIAGFLIAAVGTALAQKVECKPKKSCQTAVTFTPTVEAYGAAIGGTLDPDPGVDLPSLRLKRDRDEPFTAEVSRSAWSPLTDVRLEARVTLSSRDDPDTVIDWFPVEEVPFVFLSGDTKRTDIELEYRLVVTGNELAGIFETTITFFVEDDRDKKNKKDAVSHAVQVTIPPYTQLRLDGLVVGSEGAVLFDYAPRPSDYLAAVVAGSPLAITGAEFDRLEVATNDPAGYAVDVSATLLTGPAGSGLTTGDVLLFGVPAGGQRLTGPGPTGGFVPLLVPDDFSLVVDGDELPGSYIIRIDYEATVP